jgi:hypothetical protein
MSIHFEQYNSDGDEDQANYCRELEMKIHYLISMLQKAGVLLDANGNSVNSLPDSVMDDADEIQNSIKGNW